MLILFLPAVYTQLADITFLLFKPLDYLVKGIFLAAMLLVCSSSSVPPLDGNEAGDLRLDISEFSSCVIVYLACIHL